MQINSKDIAIIDYGSSNIKNVIRAVEINNHRPIIIYEIDKLKKFNKIILPGVGNFGYAMKKINKLKLKNFIYEHVENNKFLLGICLGMQLLLNKSKEDVKSKGIGLFKAEVLKLNCKSKIESFPHISWKKIHIKKKSNLIYNINKNDKFYFTHSFYCNVKKNNQVLAKTKYVNHHFPSIINYKNCFGTQFHPEKSRLPGLKIINNFLEM